MKKSTFVASALLCLACGANFNAAAQVDTVSLQQLDAYLSKASGNIKIYLKDWATYDHKLVAFNDSVYEVEDYSEPRFSSVFSGYDGYGDERRISIFDKYPDLRISLELEPLLSESITFGTLEGKSLVSVKFPDNFTNLGVSYRPDDIDHEMPMGFSFLAKCENLKEVILPKSLKRFGGIKECQSLEKIQFPEGMEFFCGVIDCESLKEIKLPKSLRYFGFFENCPSLTAIALPDSIIEGEFFPVPFFAGCSSLQSVNLPRNMTKLGTYTFDLDDNSSLVNGYSTFFGCKSLKTIEIPDGVKYIGECTFMGCTSLTSIKLPASVKKIGKHAFANCTSLQEIVLPDGLEEIGEFAFNGCSSLKKINIPSGVKPESIGRGAFWACKALKNDNKPNMIAVCGREMDYYDNEIVCNMFGSEIPKKAFENFSSLKSLTIPDNVSAINMGAFANCVSLKKIKLHDGIQILSDESDDYLAFQNCTSLKTVDFGKNFKGYDNFGSWQFVDTVVFRDDEFQESSQLWGELRSFTVFDLDGNESEKVVLIPALTNPDLKVYVKKELLDAYKAYMDKLNSYPSYTTKINYQFLPLDSYKE